jgi:hypothetical protein
MSEPANPEEVPDETVGAVEEAFTGNNPPAVTLPSITIEGSSVQPTIDLSFGSIVNSMDITYEVQDQPDNALPNPANCAASFDISLPNSVSASMSLTYGSAFTSDVLLRWGGSSWEDITISSGASFGAGSVTFSWTSTGRGDESFVVNGGGDSPLPVTLSSFTSAYENDASHLNWITQSESNNLGWNVYRLGNEEYLQLNNSMIPGSGTTVEPTEYEYFDDNNLYQQNTYLYWLESVDVSGMTHIYGPISVIVPIEEDDNAPDINFVYGLHQNSPNPFNPETVISFAIEEKSFVELVIYNVKGKKIRTIVSNIELQKDVIHSFVWNGRSDNGFNVASGVYLYTLKTGKHSETKKMILMK